MPELGRVVPAADVPASSHLGAAPDRFRCVLCSAADGELFLANCADLYLAKAQRVDLHRCMRCGLVQQHPIPKDISSFYDAYPVHVAKSKAYSWFRRRLLSGAYRPPKQWPRGCRLLDFGCGDGWYLDWCRGEGLNVVGFEHDPTHAKALGQRIGVPVLSDASALTAGYEGAFDAITLHFVVEHLTDPVGVLAMLARLLKPGGRIRFVVPNISSWEFGLFKRHWHSLDAPRHILFIDDNHARAIADRLAMNFDGASEVAFPNGFGGSLPTVLMGRFNATAFLMTLPLSILVTRLFPSGNKAYVLRRPA